jgi:cytosine/adenosine deaminase-related metal-dependent hydrolase
MEINIYLGFDSVVARLESYGLLDSSILISHAMQATQEDAALIKKSNSHISTTPSTELQMAMGYPVAFSETLNVQSHSSLGIDCHALTTASIPNEMRLLLQSSRALHSQKFIEVKKVPKKTNKTVEEVFNLGTIGGARAVRMEDQIGSLAVGKRADIVVFDTLSPSMIAAAQQDPVTAIVLHSSPRDVVMTIVDGIIRKYDQKLMTVRVTEGEREWAGGVKDLDWADVAKELLSRREVMAKKIAALDLKEAGEGMVKAMYMDPSAFADNV